MTSSPAALAADSGRTVFGAGGGEPYDRALRRGGGGVVLHGRADGAGHIAVARFTGRADEVERGLLTAVRGPLLDVGCGPGRMIAAALQLGIPALGVDPSAAAAELTEAAGLPMLRRSVFDHLPGEGRWGTVLLLDGNIGIGGDPALLLRRCAELIEPGGRIVTEVDPRPRWTDVFTAVLADDLGLRSAPFAWAELGAAVLTEVAESVDLAVVRRWEASGRVFLGLEAPGSTAPAAD